MRKKGFTLVEVIMVMIIVGLILSMTVFFGSEYLKELQLRKEKEEVINIINYAMSYAKSSNYFEGQKFTQLIVDIGTGTIDVHLDSVTGTGFSSYSLLRSEILILDSPQGNQIRITPYQRECEDVLYDTGNINFKLFSTVNEQEFCFMRNMALCKLFIITCP